MGVLSTYLPQSVGTRDPIAQGYRTFTEPAPHFSVWDGSLYDHPTTRAAIERFATACSKAKPEFEGSDSANMAVQGLFRTWPNPMMTWPTFLRRVATLYMMDTTAFVVPGLDRNLKTVALFPMKPLSVDVVEYQNEAWFVFHLFTGEELAIEAWRVTVLSRFQYMSDWFGSGNDVMRPVLSLMDAQRQAEEQAVQNGARIRFIGKVTGMTHGDDLERKRESFYVDNLSSKNRTGLMLYDNTFSDITQVKEDRFIIDEKEMERVNKQIYAYFGINEHIIQNCYSEEEWGAWYEGSIEPFLNMLGEGISKAELSETQRKKDRFFFSTSYLQYATPESKRKLLDDMLDRGVFNWNTALDVLQLPHFPGGNARTMRGEYYLLDENNNVIAESGGHGTGDTQSDSDLPPTSDTEPDGNNDSDVEPDAVDGVE